MFSGSKETLRVYSFTVSVSNDNKKFTDVAKLKSSGNTNGIESYNLKEVSARICANYRHSKYRE